MDKNLDINFYKNFYNDLLNLNNNDLINHYINYGINENRFANDSDFHRFFPDFDINFYKNFYDDIRKMSDIEIKKQYYYYGKNENRFANNLDFYKFFPEFNINFYKNFNEDFIKMSDFELIHHYYYYGINENRIINKNILDFFYINKKFNLKNIFLDVNLINHRSNIYEYDRNIPINYLNNLQNFELNRENKLNFKIMEENIPKKLFNQAAFHEQNEYWDYMSKYSKYIILDILLNKSFSFKCIKTNNIYRTKKSFQILIKNKHNNTDDNLIIYVFDNLDNPFFVICGGGSNWMLFFSQHIISVYYFKINELINFINFDYWDYNLYCELILNYYNNNLINDSISITTMFCLCYNIGHIYWNDISAFKFLVDLDLLKLIDKIIIGSYDYYNIYNYCIENNYNVIKEDNLECINTLLNNSSLLFKFCDYYMMDDLKDFVININPFDNIKIIENINEIKKNYYPIINFNIRGVYRYLYEQEEVISNIINNLLLIYPKLFIIFDGFIKNENTKLDNYINENKESQSLDIMEESYNNISKNIISKINTTNFISLIGKSLNEELEWLKIANYGFMQLGAGAFNHVWVMNKKALFIGRNTYINEEILLHTFHDFIYRENRDFTTYINPSNVDFNTYNNINNSYYINWKIILYYIIRDLIILEKNNYEISQYENIKKYNIYQSWGIENIINIDSLISNDNIIDNYNLLKNNINLYL